MPRIALAQINAKVGDIEGNLNKILAYLSSAKDCGVDILSFGGTKNGFIIIEDNG